MYLHLGQSVVVRQRDVLGIFDIENSSISKVTKAYLAAAQKQNKVINVTEELPKSFVVVREKEEITVYISQISVQTLKKRWPCANFESV